MRFRFLKALIPVVVGVLALEGCVLVKSTLTSFHDLPKSFSGESFVVAPIEKSKEGSLEFASYAARIAGHLEERGMKRAPDNGLTSADFVVFVGYGIDDGRTGFSGNETGVGSYVLYTRVLRVDIIDAQSIKSGNPKKRWEGVLKSSGSSGHLQETLPRLIDGMFRDFPGQSGKTRSVTN